MGYAQLKTGLDFRQILWNCKSHMKNAVKNSIIHMNNVIKSRNIHMNNALMRCKRTDSCAKMLVWIFYLA